MRLHALGSQISAGLMTYFAHAALHHFIDKLRWLPRLESLFPQHLTLRCITLWLRDLWRAA